MIEIKQVSKRIKEKTVLDHIDLVLDRGEIVLLKGHNGCGKTMLLRMIAGFIRPSEGEVIKDENLKYGVIIENPSFFPNETAMYNLRYLASINKTIDDDTICEFLKKFNLYDNRNQKVKTFSLGMKQRLALCQAFMEDPDVILLDEPFNAVDDENMETVREILKEYKEKNRLIVVASHGDIDHALFDREIRMSQGRIVA